MWCKNIKSDNLSMIYDEYIWICMYPYIFIYYDIFIL